MAPIVVHVVYVVAAVAVVVGLLLWRTHNHEPLGILLIKDGAGAAFFTAFVTKLRTSRLKPRNRR